MAQRVGAPCNAFPSQGSLFKSLHCSIFGTACLYCAQLGVQHGFKVYLGEEVCVCVCVHKHAWKAHVDRVLKRNTCPEIVGIVACLLYACQQTSITATMTS